MTTAAAMTKLHTPDRPDVVPAKDKPAMAPKPAGGEHVAEEYYNLPGDTRSGGEYFMCRLQHESLRHRTQELGELKLKRCVYVKKFHKNNSHIGWCTNLLLDVMVDNGSSCEADRLRLRNHENYSTSNLCACVRTVPFSTTDLI